MDELKARRQKKAADKHEQVIKQYMQRYAYYNTMVRPVDEKKQVMTVQGTVSWNE